MWSARRSVRRSRSSKQELLVLNPKPSRGGKLISLIEPGLFTKYSRKKPAKLPVDISLCDAFRDLGKTCVDNPYPPFIRVFLRFMDVCAGLFDSKEYVVVGIRAAGDAVRWIDVFLQWAEHCLNKIVDGEQKRVFNAKAFRCCNFNSVEQVVKNAQM